MLHRWYVSLWLGRMSRHCCCLAWTQRRLCAACATMCPASPCFASQVRLVSQVSDRRKNKSYRHWKGSSCSHFGSQIIKKKISISNLCFLCGWLAAHGEKKGKQMKDKHNTMATGMRRWISPDPSRPVQGISDRAIWGRLGYPFLRTACAL